eukprot:Gregarina_sp_Poly_1__9336@NODE_57_length_17266_cov_72_799233_g19_i1_p6_GENE_NODE_57_length_17266_cov_72_799233_g19_i1NODE_57_length_17266_cov_72_799233_g19_i1_p6_ORF_typecomplete_len322_score22_30AMPbinding/PF00501_28/1_5e24_NODE_57_length_17266_cov_72_799233_g19_i11605617021
MALMLDLETNVFPAWQKMFLRERATSDCKESRLMCAFLAPRFYPQDDEYVYSIAQFVERLKEHYGCDDPLAQIPTPLHLFRHLVKTNPNETCAYWPHPKYNKYEQLTYRRLWDLSNRMLTYLKHNMLSETIPGAVVGVLCDDNPNLLILLLALYRGGFVSLLLSTRNSRDGTEHLCLDADAEVVITSQPDLTSSLVDDIQIHNYEKMSLSSMEALPLDPELDNEIQLNTGGHILEKVPFILHSSGSTRHPELIRISHRWMYVNGLGVHAWSQAPKFSSLNVGPLYHAMTFAATFCSGLVGVTPFCFTLSTFFPPRPSEIMM